MPPRTRRGGCLGLLRVTRPLIVRFLAPLGMTWQGNASSFAKLTAWWPCFEKHCPTTCGSIRHSGTSFSPRGGEDGCHSHRNLRHRTSQPRGRRGAGSALARVADVAISRGSGQSLRVDHAGIAQPRARRDPAAKDFPRERSWRSRA